MANIRRWSFWSSAISGLLALSALGASTPPAARPTPAAKAPPTAISTAGPINAKPSQLPFRTLTGFQNMVETLAFSPNSRLLASGGDDQLIHLWNVKTGRAVRVLRGDTSVINAVAFSPDGKLLASCGNDDSARVWNVKTGRLLNIFLDPRHVLTVCFVPGGKYLLTGDCTGAIRLWNLKTNRQSAIFPVKDDCLFRLVIGPRGRTLYSGGDGAVREWNLGARLFERTIAKMPGDVHLLGLVNRNHIFVQDGTKTVRLLAIRAKNGVNLVKHYNVVMVDGSTMSPHNHWVYLSHDGFVYRVNPLTLRTTPLPFLSDEGQLRALAISPNGKYLAGGPVGDEPTSANKIFIWKMPAQKRTTRKG